MTIDRAALLEMHAELESVLFAKEQAVAACDFDLAMKLRHRGDRLRKIYATAVCNAMPALIAALDAVERERDEARAQVQLALEHTGCKVLPEEPLARLRAALEQAKAAIHPWHCGLVGCKCCEHKDKALAALDAVLD